jgi:hypothetical protein
MEARADHRAGHVPAGRGPSGDGADGGPAALEQLPAACPACGAGVRGDVTWCLRCYANLRPDPPSRPRPADPPRPGSGPLPAAPDQLFDGVQAPPGTGPGQLALTPEQVEALADRMLVELAASTADRPGWFGRAPRTPGATILYGIIGLAVISVVLLGVGAVVGHVVGSR